MRHSALLALAASALVSMPAFAAESYTIDSRHTYPTFEVNHLGFSTQRGRFDGTSGRIVLDPAGKGGSIEVRIDANSVDMGMDVWNKHMRSDEFFDAEKYPAITFKSDRLTYDASGNLTGAEGSLTMHGVTRPATLKVTAFHCASDPLTRKWKCGADAVTTVKRSEFGITKYVPGVSDDVKVDIAVEAFRE